ncbi:uncharacterized protein TNCV_2337691 [Trichonephila clavipes]|nr:uncharacterized protein TNCV_2337691 [Trichonephila clavipes]
MQPIKLTDAKMEKNTRIGVVLVPALVKTLKEDLKEQYVVYQGYPKYAILDPDLDIERVISFVLNLDYQDSPRGCGSPVVKVSNHGRHVMSSIPVPLKTRRVGQRCTLNLSRAEASSRWCGVVVRRGGCQLRCRPRHLTMVQNYVVRRQKPSCS